MIDSVRKWSPFTVGCRFFIKPVFCDGKKELININLGAGRAFGSGEHETTRQCLELMEKLSFSPNDKVLDYGTGTGILAIAAAKLTAGFVLAIDIDFHAVLACQNNIKLNLLDQKIFPACGDLACIDPRIQFDVILANISADIIIENDLLLNNYLKRAGTILLSGIAWEFFDDVKRIFSRLNYQIVNQKIGSDYNSILYRKITDS